MRSSPTAEFAVTSLLALFVSVGTICADSAADVPQPSGRAPSLATRFLEADSLLFPGLTTDAARAAFDRITARARACRSTSADDRAECVVRALFETVPISPASEPSRPEESTMTFALTEGRGSCAALAAVALSVANDTGVKLEAWVHGEHVVVAAPRNTRYFELLEGGRVRMWRQASGSSKTNIRGTRVSAESYLGYYLDNLAVRLASAGDTSRAETAFQRAVEITPRAGRIRFNYGTYLLDRKQATDAIEQLHRAVHLDDRNADAWTNLGVAYAQTGEVFHARKSFNKALHIDPHNANARRNLDAIKPGAGPSSASPPR